MPVAWFEDSLTDMVEAFASVITCESLVKTLLEVSNSSIAREYHSILDIIVSQEPEKKPIEST